MSATEFVIGRNSCRLVLEQAAVRAQKLLLSDRSSEATGLIAHLQEVATRHAVPVEVVGKDKLTDLVGSASHQGVALAVKPRVMLEFKQLVKQVAAKESALILALDSIQDPHNVGALLRAAECFAVDAVLWSKNRGATVTSAVTKVSVGASEILPLVQVSNLATSLKKLTDAGCWSVVAHCDQSAGALQDFEWPAKTVLVMGGESMGAKSRTVRESDFRVYIPMHGRIDSLNVSQAAAVLLNAARQADGR